MKDLYVEGRLLAVPDEVISVFRRGSEYCLQTSRAVGIGSDFVPISMWTNEYHPHVIWGRVLYLPKWTQSVFERAGDIFVIANGVDMAIGRARPSEKGKFITL